MTGPFGDQMTMMRMMINCVEVIKQSYDVENKVLSFHDMYQSVSREKMRSSNISSHHLIIQGSHTGLYHGNRSSDVNTDLIVLKGIVNH